MWLYVLKFDNRTYYQIYFLVFTLLLNFYKEKFFTFFLNPPPCMWLFLMFKLEGTLNLLSAIQYSLNTWTFNTQYCFASCTIDRHDCLWLLWWMCDVFIAYILVELSWPQAFNSKNPEVSIKQISVYIFTLHPISTITCKRLKSLFTEHKNYIIERKVRLLDC